MTTGNSRPRGGQSARYESGPSEPEVRRFWLLAVAVCLTLAVVAGGLTIANATRGPVLAGASIAAERAVATGGERLVLRGRQPLAEVAPEQVEISPEAEFTIETRDAQVVIRFSRPLAYATDYTVTVREARSRHTGASSDWRYSFRTPGYTVYSLVGEGPWAHGEADQVIRTDPVTGESTTVLTATGIEAFTVVADTTVALCRDPGSTHLLAAAPGTEPVELPVPSGTDIGLLAGSAEEPLIGYTITGTDEATGRSFDNTLFLQDAADLTQPAREVRGTGGEELRVVDWAFIPGTQSLVVQDDAQQLYLASTAADANLAPLGNHDQLVGFLPGSTSLVVVDQAEEVILDLATGTVTALPEPSDEADNTFGGKRTMITPDEWIQQVDDLSDTGEGINPTSRIIHARGAVAEPTPSPTDSPDGSTAASTTQDLATIGPSLGRLLDTGVSANGQYAWAEVLDPEAPPDDLTSGATTGVLTFIFDLATATPVATAPGGQVLWVTE